MFFFYLEYHGIDKEVFSSAAIVGTFNVTTNHTMKTCCCWRIQRGRSLIGCFFFFFFRLLDSVSEFVIQILLEMESLTLQYISDKTI